DGLENVVSNGAFLNRLDGWDFWEQNESADDTRGQVSVIAPNDPRGPAVALHILRNSALLAHNETGVHQRLLKDVSGARSVVLDMQLKVDSASLSGGGYLGTEYPLMIRLRYQTLR